MAVVNHSKEVSRFEIYLVNLDPTVGSEIRKTRPCMIVSPDEVNHNISTVIIAPMTTRKRRYPTRVSLTFQNKSGQIALDQIRTIDKVRLVKRLGVLSSVTSRKVSEVLVEMFEI